MKVAVAGHTCLDIIPDWQSGGIDSLKPNHMVKMEGIEFATGGVVPNTGLALHKLGVETKLIGKIADDIIGEIIVNLLEENGSNLTEHMITGDDEVSSYTVVLSPENTDRIFLHYPGPNDTFQAGDIPYEDLNQVDIFHLGYPPILKKFYENKGKEAVLAFQKMRERGALTSLDMTMPDPASEAGQVNWKGYLENVLPYVNIFTPSFEELLFMVDGERHRLYEEGKLRITGELLEELGKKIIEMGSDMVLIKLGSQGLYFKSSNVNGFSESGDESLFGQMVDTEIWSQKELLSPCFSVKVAGTTGAGDSTVAGFIASMLAGSSPARAMETATAVGAHSVESLGATTGLRSLSKVRHRIQEGWQRRNLEIPLSGWDYREEKQIWQKS